MSPRWLAGNIHVAIRPFSGNAQPAANSANAVIFVDLTTESDKCVGDIRAAIAVSSCWR
jgi:hypothetical protein